MASPSLSFDAARAYELLYRARRSDEELGKAVERGDIPLPIHLSIGQEAVSVGVCLALEKKDVVVGTYRGHAMYIAKGGDLRKMFAELNGKSTGSAKGKGGSMHLVDTDVGVMGTSGIVGTGIANATGYALGLQCQGKKNVVANFFGDGAVEEGSFHESLNFAALKKLPIIYVCENNEYAINSRRRVRQPSGNIVDRAKAMGISSKWIPGNDCRAIFREVRKAREAILRQGKGPFFLECQTFRWKEHLGPNDDYGPGGRDWKEAEPWIKNDELKRVGAGLPKGTRTQIEERIEREIADALHYAGTSPDPRASDLWVDAYSK